MSKRGSQSRRLSAQRSTRIQKQTVQNKSMSFEGYKREIHLGPLPHPDILRGYDEIVPGAADRLITMAEKQQSHRQGLENKVIDSDIRALKRGQVFGFIVTIILVITGSVFLSLDKDIGALASYISAAAFLVSSFIGAFSKKKANISSKEN